MKKNGISKLITFLIICLTPVVIMAQENQIFRYSANFFCGKPGKNELVPGTYLTAISVHNPNDETCTFNKRFSIALPRQTPGPMTDFYKGKLGPNQAMEIDCPEIRILFKKMGYTEEFLKGFVLINSNVKLNLTAIYSAAGASGHVESIHVEQIKPFSTSDYQNGSSDSCQCEPIPEEGEQCMYRISKNSNITISDSSGNQYPCELGITNKFKRKATFVLNGNIACDESIQFIPDSSSIIAKGFEIIRADSTALFTGSFSLCDPNNTELGTGYIYILSRAGTHRSPLPTNSQCESCNQYWHSEGFLCGQLSRQNKIYQLYCQIAVSRWNPSPAFAAPIATIEGMLVE